MHKIRFQVSQGGFGVHLHQIIKTVQTHKFERIGGEQTLSVNVRIIAATNKDLLQEVKDGRFREDLFYRLNVIPINLPPLNKRRNDIPLQARHFLPGLSSLWAGQARSA